MMIKAAATFVGLVAVLVLPGSARGAAQAPVTKSASVSATATIQAIDSTARTITLRDEKGQEDTYSVGPEVTRFDELKVGDAVTMTYYESMVFQIRKPGDAPGAATIDASVNRGKGALPGVSASVQEKMTVTVKAIDPAVPFGHGHHFRWPHCDAQGGGQKEHRGTEGRRPNRYHLHARLADQRSACQMNGDAVPR